MAKTKEKETLKEFECPNCGTIHIVNSRLDIKHSFYEEDPEQAEKVAEAKGAGSGKEEDRESSSRKEASETFKEEEQAKKQEEEDPEFEEEFEEEDKEDDPYNWGGWK